MARDRRPRDEDDDDDDRPRRKRRPAEDDEEEPRPTKKPRVVQEDDEDEDEPPRRVKPRVVDEDDEEEERPRRRKKKKKPAGMNKGLLFGLIGGGVALVGLVVLLIVLLGGSSPKSVMAKVVRGLKSGDYGVVYDNMTTAAQQGIGRGPGGLGGGSSNPRERFIETMKAAEKMGFNPADKMGNVTILGETITGNTAVVRIRDSNGKEDTVPFVKENGVWKLGGF